MSATDLAGAPPSRAAVNISTTASSYVEWGPIFAGAVLAAALSLVLFAFAGGVGLAISSPWPGEGAGLETLSVLSIAWTMIVIIFSTFAGAYIAGRLRSPRAEASVDEVEVRDGAHGVLVWAAGLLLSAVAAMALSLAQMTVQQANPEANAPLAYETDRLLRGVDEDRVELREEVEPILANAAANGELSSEDRAYLASLIAERADVSESEAQSRVDRWTANMVERTDAARKYGVLGAFLLAATMLTAAAAAYFAGGLGGRHRDRNAPFPWTRVRVSA